MKKGRAIAAIVFNVLILGAVGFAIINLIVGVVGQKLDNPLTAFTFIPVFVGVCLALAAIISLISDIAIAAGKKPAAFPAAFKLMAVGASLASLVFAVFYLGIYGKDNTQFTDYGTNLELNIIAPVLGLITILLENKPKMKWPVAFLAMIPMVAYFAFVMIGHMAIGIKNPDLNPYGILDFASGNIGLNISIIAGLIVGAFFLALIVFGFRCIKNEEKAELAEPVSEEPQVIEEPVAEEKVEEPAPEPVVEEAKEEPKAEEKVEEAKPEEEPAPEEKAEEPAPVVEEQKEEPKPQPKPAPRPAAKPVIRNPAPRPAPRPAAKPAVKPAAVPTATGGPRVYHIAKHPSGQWSVKLASSNKVIKLFNTQAEAIGYAKGLVESRGGSYRIHSVSGKLRKE